jgi:hypothetical protein
MCVGSQICGHHTRATGCFHPVEGVAGWATLGVRWVTLHRNLLSGYRYLVRWQMWLAVLDIADRAYSSVA